MNKEEKIKISVNEEDIQNFINCYKKDIEYIMQLEKENKQLKEHIEKYERYCKTTGIEELMQNKKYKEVFEKALDFIDCHFKEMVADEEAQELKSILKEVEE